jgi:hypothetical protein
VGIGLLGLVIAGKFPLNGYPIIMMGPLYLIFVVNALQLHANKIAFNYLEEWMFAFTSFVCLVSFLSVIAGWCYVDVKPKELFSKKKASTVSKISYNRLFTIGTICHILSFIGELLIAAKQGGLIAMYSKPHSFYIGDMDTDYVYLLFYLTFIGVIPYLQCFFCDKNLPIFKRIIIIAVCGLQIIRTVLVGQRAWIFNLVYIYITVPFFCIGKWPKVRQVAYFLLPAIIMVIILPPLRGTIYIGSNKLEQLPEKVIEALRDAQKGSAGSGIYEVENPSRVASEFILGAGTISAAWESGSYTYGASFYEILVSPIPRAWWKDKPKDLAHKNQINTIETHFYWHQIFGSFPTGIADVFLNLGFGCIFFWFFLGRVYRWVYDLASRPGNFYAQAVYVCLLLSSVFLLTQSLYMWGTNTIATLVVTTVFYSYARIVKHRKTALSLHPKL